MTAAAAQRAKGTSPLLVVGVVMISVLVLVSLLAPWIAPYEPKAITGDSFEDSSWSHLLGTNDAGADIFSRVVWGGRSTMIVAFGATSIVLTIGIVVGLTAGLRGGFIDTAAMRVVDIFLALPVVPLLIFIAALAGPSLTLSIFMIGLFVWPQTARIVRSQTLSLRTRGYVDSARGFGAGPLYVMRRHLLPALGPVIAANLVFVAGVVIIIEAALAFLGLGDPAAVSWGSEMNRALRTPEIQLGSVWLRWLVPPGLALSLAIFGFALIGVALEPRFNPRWNRAQ